MRAGQVRAAQMGRLLEGRKADKIKPLWLKGGNTPVPRGCDGGRNSHGAGCLVCCLRDSPTGLTRGCHTRLRAGKSNVTVKVASSQGLELGFDSDMPDGD